MKFVFVCVYVTVTVCVRERLFACACVVNAMGVRVEVRGQFCGVISAHILLVPGIDLELMGLRGNLVYQQNHFAIPNFFIYKISKIGLKVLIQVFTS